MLVRLIQRAAWRQHGACQARAPRVSMSSGRARRVLFNVPGSDERKVRKAISEMDLDTVVLDLEDGVAESKKEVARVAVGRVLEKEHASFGRAERLVRVNAIGSGHEHADFEALAPHVRHIDGIVVPKVERREELDEVWGLLHGSKSAESNVVLLAAIESARGIINLPSICAHPRVDALIFASEDYCADVGITRTKHARELLHARSSIVTHAAAFNLQAIDMVCIDFKDEQRLRDEAAEGAEMGFTGKQAIHPAQVEPIYECFRPPAATLELAREIKERFEQESEQGRGAFSINGKMIDMPMYKWALKEWPLQEACG